jgi:predicted chitinase
VPSENGWEPSHAPPELLEWRVIPGTDPPVHLQLMKGWPSTIMTAFAADYNAYVEHLRDGDSGGFTPTNSVPTSNHLNGTAMDLNWNGADEHTFRLGITEGRAYPGDEARNLRELLAFYNHEGLQIMFCGGEWDIRDWMHMQMDGNTWNNPTVLRFINDKIRPDGFSRYRREGIPGPPPPPPPPLNNAVDVLVRATGITSAKAQQILPTVIDGLRLSQCTNVNRIAMWLAQIGHESGSFVYTEEIQSGDESTDRWLYKGRTWIQITWRSNYADFSKWLFDKGLIGSPTYFVDHPKELADVRWAGIGPAWYWTVQRPQINSLCDQRDLVAVTQAINGGQNGAADRGRRYEMVLALGDQLLALISNAPLQPPPPPGEDELSAEAERMIAVIYQEVTKKFPSRSPLRHLDEGVVDTWAGFTLNVDSSVHVEIVKTLASLGHKPSLALLWDIAHADPVKYPDRQSDRDIAQRILADVTSDTAAVASESASMPAQLAAAYAEIARLRQEIARLQALPAPVVSTEVATIEPAAPTTGQSVGRIVDAGQEWARVSLAMDKVQQHALDSSLQLIKMQTNGTEQ